ncbi:cell adhesion molecule CEACAM21-like [Myotis yumanensis]|uniref:cell adhesion molecule CEACAM21-like n=1 Tax=Myotis yumanensis TaxID=159337 RepID=UPI0038D37F42
MKCTAASAVKELVPMVGLLLAGFIWYRGIEMKIDNFIGSREWYSSEYLTGPQYSGREQINLEGTLIIRNVTARDQDIYLVVAVLPESRRVKRFGWLIVYPWFGNLVQDTDSGDKHTKVNVLFPDSSPTDIHHIEKKQFDGSEGALSVPTLIASNTIVTENEDAVVMTCHTDESSINWLFNAMRLLLTEKLKLSQDHRTLTIDPVRREEGGKYQCKVSHPFFSVTSAPVELDVKY